MTAEERAKLLLFGPEYEMAEWEWDDEDDYYISPRDLAKAIRQAEIAAHNAAIEKVISFMNEYAGPPDEDFRALKLPEDRA